MDYNKFEDRISDWIENSMDIKERREFEKFLKDNNLLEQYDKFKSVKPRFHIHGCNNEDELTDYDLLVNTKCDDVIYVCRHTSSIDLDNAINSR